MLLFEILLIMLIILINVAFITLFERKILSFSQNRLGPNKVSFMGILQPMSDAVKLFTKQEVSLMGAVNLMFNLSPILMLTLMLMIWSIGQTKYMVVYSKYSIIFLLMVLGLGVYPLLFAGWYSNNTYSYIGAIRSVAQTISYEICMAFYLMIFITYYMTLNMSIPMKFNPMSLILYLPLFFVVWLVIMLAETNRTPFDFAEGESELVSGFNIEYSGVNFALLFMAEYGMIYFMSYLSSVLFFNSINMYLFFMLTLSIIYFWMWSRATLPRHRYDLLMALAWKSLLPVSLGVSILTVTILL